MIAIPNLTTLHYKYALNTTFIHCAKKTHNATSCTNDFKLKIAITTALTIQKLLLKLVQFCNIQPYERNLLILIPFKKTEFEKQTVHLVLFNISND